MKVVSKDTALSLLAEHKHELLAGRAGCVMCALANARPGSLLIAENQHGAVLLDRFGCRYGHLMVVAKQHIERANSLDWAVYSDLQRLVFDATAVIDACFKPARVFTATLGAAVELPQTYSHYHVHVIPVYETDERARPARVLSWSEGVVVYEDAEAEGICRELRQAWPRATQLQPKSAE
ncbi:MAG TPA: HIT family protein [Polyangiaceae bacterium]|nr:HIT family protein [Polyangiaceae bacterium]